MSDVISAEFSTSMLHEQPVAKFADCRSRLMLGDIPADFLRLEHSNSSPMQDGNIEFLGYLTLIVSEAKLVKNSGPLGLLRMDPYVRFQIGPIVHHTPTANGGGKTPQWNAIYRLNLFKGMNEIHLEVYDQRNFTEDNFIGQCDIEIPNELFTGKTSQHWYLLKGNDSNADEIQGEILIIMSFSVSLPTDMVMVDDRNSSSSSSSSSPSNSVSESTPIYSLDDVRIIEDMFPSVDRQIIINLLEKHGGTMKLSDLIINMSHSDGRATNPDTDEYQGIQVSEPKFWRKIKQDPVVPIGMAGFGLIVLGAIIGFNRRDRNKPTSTYWIRTRVFAQGFVVSLLTGAAIYHALKDDHSPHDIHGHKLESNDRAHVTHK